MEDTIRSFFDRAVQETPGRVAMEYFIAGQRQKRTYSEINTRVRNLAELIASLGVHPRSRPVALLLENGPDWVEAFLALTCTAIAVVPMDPKFRPAELHHILSDSGACAIITDTGHIPALERILPDLPNVRNILLFELDFSKVPESICERPCLSINERVLLGKYKAKSPQGRYRTTSPAPEDVAVIIYTSGSTGKPKGAMLTHRNVHADTVGTIAGVQILNSNDRFLVVLPLFHSFSLTCNLLIPIYLTARMQFVTSLRTIGDDMRKFASTIFMAVPLLVEKIGLRIDNGLKTNHLMLFFQALGWRGIVKHLVRIHLGGHLRLIIVGGAPCPSNVITLMSRMGVACVDGYGLTEASPVVSISPPSEARIGSIGRPLPNVRVRIDNPDEFGIGELLVKGDIVMKGYLNLPKATAETLSEDGWLRTGDLVSQDPDGFLSIRGRKKVLIVNREGKNIYPEELELCLVRDPLIKEVLVLGYRDHQEIGEKVGAIVVPDLDAFKTPDGKLPPREEIEQRVRAAIHTQCGDLATYKHPRKIEISYKPFLRTAAMKIDRKSYQGKLDKV